MLSSFDTLNWLLGDHLELITLTLGACVVHWILPFDFFTFVELLFLLLILLFFWLIYRNTKKDIKGSAFILPLSYKKKIYYSTVSGGIFFLAFLSFLLISDILTPDKQMEPLPLSLILFILMLSSLGIVFWSFVNINIYERLLIWFRSLQNREQ